MAKAEASEVSVNGRSGSAAHRTGALVKACLRVAKAVSWAGVHMYGLSFFKRSVRAVALVEKLATNHQ